MVAWRVDAISAKVFADAILHATFRRPGVDPAELSSAIAMEVGRGNLEIWSIPEQNLVPTLARVATAELCSYCDWGTCYEYGYAFS